MIRRMITTVRADFGAAAIERHLAIVNTLLVARLVAEPFFQCLWLNFTSLWNVWPHSRILSECGNSQERKRAAKNEIDPDRGHWNAIFRNAAVSRLDRSLATVTPIVALEFENDKFILSQLCTSTIASIV